MITGIRHESLEKIACPQKSAVGLFQEEIGSFQGEAAKFCAPFAKEYSAAEGDLHVFHDVPGRAGLKYG